jgi:hypothetical protein
MVFYTVYKTMNLLNGKFYFGVHKTENPDDDYLGSGTYIKRAVAKHGVQNFRKEVLFAYADSNLAFEKEDELIRMHRGFNPLCMNLKRGGNGGFDWINENGLADHTQCGLAMNKVIQKRLSSDPVYASQWMKMQNQKQQLMQRRANDLEIKQKAAAGRRGVWVGKHHTKKTKNLIAAKARLRMGSLNSQFGTRWVTNGTENAKVSKERPIPQGWRLGRSMCQSVLRAVKRKRCRKASPPTKFTGDKSARLVSVGLLRQMREKHGC